jgi:hypothetical protein
MSLPIDSWLKRPNVVDDATQVGLNVNASAFTYRSLVALRTQVSTAAPLMSLL